MLVANMNVNGGDTGRAVRLRRKGLARRPEHLQPGRRGDHRPDGWTPVYFDFDSFQDIEVVDRRLRSRRSRRRASRSIWSPGEAPTSSRALAAPIYFFPSSVDSHQVSSQGSWDYGLEAGGPLWKDRLWLWAAGAGNNIPGETFFLPDGEPFRPTTDLAQWNAKLNAQPVPANSLTLFYLHFDKVFDGRVRRP